MISTAPPEPGAAAGVDRAPALDMRPLLFEAFACSLSMMSFVAALGPLTRALQLAPWQAGAVMTAGGLTLALCARGWGALSDQRGRRRILLLGLGGFCVCHLAMNGFVGLVLHDPVSTWLAFAGLLLLRAMSGAFYAAVPATGAALVADHVPPDRRASALAGLGAASALGLVAGPGFTSVLAGYSLAIPLGVAAALPFAAWWVMWRWLPHSPRHLAPDAASLSMLDRRVRAPVLIAFTSMCCVSIAQITVGFFALDRLQLGAASAAQSAGIALTVVGVALIMAQLLLRMRQQTPRQWIGAGGLVAAAGFGSVAFAETPLALWAGYFIAAFGMGWVFPSVAGLAANAVRGHEQGRAAGAIASAHGWGMIIGPLVGTLVYGVHVGAPYLLLGGLMWLVALWALGHQRAS